MLNIGDNFTTFTFPKYFPNYGVTFRLPDSKLKNVKTSLISIILMLFGE